MEDEKLADKLLDRILMVLMPYDQIDVERIKAKLTVVLDDYQICPKQEALVVYTEGKNDYYLRKFLLAKAVAGRQERTLRQYKDEVGRALRGIGKDADTITADDIQVYLAKVLSRGGSKCYCDNIRRDLSSFYNWLYREEIIRTNPMNKIDNIKFKREKEKALTDMEIEMMRQACQTTMQKAIMEMLLSTGCRAAELVSIKIADMDEDKVSILGKGGKWRTVYINAKAFVAVKNYLADRKDTNPYLFQREINTKDRTMISNFSRKDWFKDPRLVTKADHFGRDSVNNMVRTIGKRAGVKGVHTHRFRRTCATLADFALLDKLDTEEAKNEVLKSVGTNNFRACLDRALREQKDRKTMNAIREVVASYATKADSKAAMPENCLFYANYGSWSGTAEAPADAGEHAYWYTESGYGITVYRERTEEDEPAEKTPEQLAREAKIEEYREKCRVIEEDEESAYRLRLNYLKEYGFPKKAAEAVAFAACRMIIMNHDALGDMDEDTIEAVYGDGIYNDEHDLDTAVLMENAQVNPMKMLMVLLFALTEPVNHRVHDTEWLGGFYKCIKDDESVYRGIYSALDGIGYEISDMEKSLLDGTHPSYEGAEEES